MPFFKKITMVQKGLKYKLLLAFALMSVIPLLACTYVISIYVFPQAEEIINISTVIVFAIVIAALGLLLARGLVNPVIDMAIEAKIIASGEYDRRIAIASDDEVGNLAGSINSMTQKIRSNLDELKGYGQKMREINVEIHKKVLALSSLLQIGDLIATGTFQLDSVLELAVEKAAMVFDTGFGVLYMQKDGKGDYTPKVSYNIDKEPLEDMAIKAEEGGVLAKVLEGHSIMIVDKSAKASREMEEFKASYNLRNILAIPIYSGRQNLGLFLVGTRLEDFKFKTDDLDLVKVFAKQMTIAMESDLLSKRTSELAIKDDLTDLYNKNFILTRLEEEIKRAIFYQRPCSFIIFNIDNFKKFCDTHGELAAEEALKKLAKLLRDNTSPVGKVARTGGDEFAMLLPEKNKKEATYAAEEIRKKVETANLLKEGKSALTVSIGVSENPIDGVTSDELFKKAMEAMKEAKSSGKNRVVA